MSPDSLSTVLLLSSFVSGAMILVLLVSRQSLGDASRGTSAWIIGDIAHAFARTLLVGSLSPGFIEAWQDHIGAWHQHHLAASLHAVGFWCQWLALRTSTGVSVTKPRVAAFTVAVLFLASNVLIGGIPSVGLRKTVALALVVAFSALLLHSAWPLARRSWGARLMVLTCSVTMMGIGARLIGSVFGIHGMMALGDMTQEKDFVGELVASLAVTMAFVLMQQERLRECIVELSVTDALTGALNRNGLLPMLRRELLASHRSGLPLSVVLFDLDHFKRINDGYGHGAGDIVLRNVADLIKSRIRPRDALCRWGGEEFLLMLPEQRGEMATLMARRIVMALRESRLDVGNDTQLTVTVSAGVATLDGDQPATDQVDALLDPLIAEADRRLYQAKIRRDCVVSHRAEFAPALTPEELACV